MVLEEEEEEEEKNDVNDDMRNEVKKYENEEQDVKVSSGIEQEHQAREYDGEILKQNEFGLEHKLVDDSGSKTNEELAPPNDDDRTDYRKNDLNEIGQEEGILSKEKKHEKEQIYDSDDTIDGEEKDILQKNTINTEPDDDVIDEEEIVFEEEEDDDDNEEEDNREEGENDEENSLGEDEGSEVGDQKSQRYEHIQTNQRIESKEYEIVLSDSEFNYTEEGGTSERVISEMKSSPQSKTASVLSDMSEDHEEGQEEDELKYYEEEGQDEDELNEGLVNIQETGQMQSSEDVMESSGAYLPQKEEQEEEWNDELNEQSTYNNKVEELQQQNVDESDRKRQRKRGGGEEEEKRHNDSSHDNSPSTHHPRATPSPTPSQVRHLEHVDAYQIHGKNIHKLSGVYCRALAPTGSFRFINAAPLFVQDFLDAPKKFLHKNSNGCWCVSQGELGLYGHVHDLVATCSSEVPTQNNLEFFVFDKKNRTMVKDSSIWIEEVNENLEEVNDTLHDNNESEILIDNNDRNKKKKRIENETTTSDGFLIPGTPKHRRQSKSRSQKYNKQTHHQYQNLEENNEEKDKDVSDSLLDRMSTHKDMKQYEKHHDISSSNLIPYSPYSTTSSFRSVYADNSMDITQHLTANENDIEIVKMSSSDRFVTLSGIKIQHIHHDQHHHKETLVMEISIRNHVDDKNKPFIITKNCLCSSSQQIQQQDNENQNIIISEWYVPTIFILGLSGWVLANSLGSTVKPRIDIAIYKVNQSVLQLIAMTKKSLDLRRRKLGQIEPPFSKPLIDQNGDRVGEFTGLVSISSRAPVLRQK
mmetsp:Transcript_9437/g.11380  ORF Transcript_9437/g.11380 Transcript_9437/m.11380 type:complete len:811 (+) Transcript_9437:144-2576(+)